MKLTYILPVAAVILLSSFVLMSPYKTSHLFDGKTFAGWQGDTVNTWRISDGMLIGGSVDKMQPHNEFISTTETYSNYILRLKFKLTGTEGFINTGVQFHSKRISNPPYEMTGYQADLGDGFWGCLYDESRRDRILIAPDSNVIKKALRRNQWNDYEIYSNNGRIRIKLNGAQTIDYTEPDKTIPQQGHIALQLHGGGKTQVSYKDIVLQEIK
ncbi:MAG: DUF1080 domain-containing protein [Sphingobacteriaceae bacterium]|nr:MAG: DUF1080 domain-containing protein [Sphingobacteriaceae bacterium]